MSGLRGSPRAILCVFCSDVPASRVKRMQPTASTRSRGGRVLWSLGFAHMSGLSPGVRGPGHHLVRTLARPKRKNVRTSSQPFGCAFPSHMSVHTGALRTGSRSAPIGDQPKSGLGSGPILSATALVLSVIALRVPAIYVLSTASTYIHVRACAHPCVCSCREETHNFDIYSDRPRRQGSEQRAGRLRSLNRCVRDRILEFRLAVER